MQRIICHWTGGGYKATALDRKRYHFIFEGNGREVAGEHQVRDNRNTRDGRYAAHTRGCNTGSIGLSMACMLDAKSETDTGNHPMTEAQYRAMVGKAAALARRYNIPVTRETVLWHAEVESNLGIQQRGKWDATVLPFDGTVGREACGERLRRDVIAAMAAQAYPQGSGPASFGIAGGSPVPLELDEAGIEDELRRLGSRTIENADAVEDGSFWGRIWSAATGGGALTTLPWLGELPVPVALALIAVAAMAAILFWLEWKKAAAARAIRAARVDDARTGANTARLEALRAAIAAENEEAKLDEKARRAP